MINGQLTTMQVGPGPVKVGTKTYYIDRVNDFIKRNPGKKAPSYYISYGDFHLRKFLLETRQTLSPEGKEWLDKTLVNLQRAIEDKLINTKDGATIENNDDKFTDFAFDTHVKAYEDAGILDLSVMDKIKILLTPTAETLFSDRGLSQAASIAKDQAWHYLFNPRFFLRQIKEFASHYQEILNMVDEYYKKNQRFFDEQMKQNPQHWSNPKFIIMGIIRDFFNPTIII
jgi:hypothetical protein